MAHDINRDDLRELASTYWRIQKDTGYQTWHLHICQRSDRQILICAIEEQPDGRKIGTSETVSNLPIEVERAVRRIAEKAPIQTVMIDDCLRQFLESPDRLL